MPRRRESYPAQRAAFRSVYQGVYWNKHTRKWRARVKVGPIYHYGGEYPTELEAALAYDELSRTFRKPPEELNFPER